MVVLNFKVARDKYPPTIQNPDEAEFKIGDMVLLNIWYLIKPLEVQDSAEESQKCICTTPPIITSHWTCTDAPTWHNLIWTDDEIH